MSRTVSYANLGDHAENSSDESFDSNEMDEREDEWDGSDSEEAQSRRRKRNGGSRRQASGRWPQSQTRYNVSVAPNSSISNIIFISLILYSDTTTATRLYGISLKNTPTSEQSSLCFTTLSPKT